jgi:hypothetical protein
MALADTIWWTRKSKIHAEKRLLRNAFQAQVILLWYSFAAVAASVYYLQFDSSNQEMAGIAWLVYSVLILSVSGFIQGLSFKERAALIKSCYEALNVVENAAREDGANIAELSVAYEQVLNSCENHRERDYFAALCEESLISQNPDDLTKKPTKYVWLQYALNGLKRSVMLGVFYFMPILLFYILEGTNC